MNKIIIISGATASGKSKLALGLAKKCNGVIINADSMQIYQGLPILSAQPSKEDHKEAKHRLYSKFHPSESCSVGIWLKLVRKEIDLTRKVRKTPIIVGGTGMYISSLIKGLSPIPNVSEDVKKEAINLYEKLGHNEFLNLVSKIDSKTTSKLNKNDKQRLLRTYEVFRQTEKPLSEWQKIKNINPYKTNELFHININCPREELYKKINNRFQEMLKDGSAINEVKVFLKKYPEAIENNYNIANTLGLLEIKRFIDGQISYDEMVNLATQKTRNYAKRQLTWFRHMEDVNTIHMDKDEEKLLIDKFNNNYQF